MNIEIKKLAPKIIHFQFDTQAEMCETMLRFEEFYESPKYHGKIFTLDEFKAYYTATYGEFSYYTDWDGFNVPGPCFTPFYLGKFNPLEDKEQQVLNMLTDFAFTDHATMVEFCSMKYCVIATSTEAAPETFKHEYAHALYATSWKYRWLVRASLLTAALDLPSVFDWLLSEKYTWKVLVDESHAYMLANQDYLASEDVSVNRITNRLLNTIYTLFGGKN